METTLFGNFWLLKKPNVVFEMSILEFVNKFHPKTKKL